MLSWYSESNASRASPFQKRVFGTSQLLSRIGVCLPFAAAIAFAFQNSLLRFLDSLLFSETPVSHFAVVQQQYSFLLQKDGNQHS
jgi:hypothetical protein